MIDEKMIFDAATKTKGSAGPSGMDTELFTKNLFKIAYYPSLLEGYTSCRLIPLDKNPGIRPIGVAEVLRRIVGKTIAGFLKEELKRQRAPFRIAQAIAQAQRPR